MRGCVRVVALGLICILAVPGIDTALADQADVAETRLRRIERRIDRHRTQRRIERRQFRVSTRRAAHATRRVRTRVVHARRVAMRAPVQAPVLEPRIRAAVRRRDELEAQRRGSRARLARHRAAVRRLRSTARTTSALLSRLRPIGICPVQAATAISDDFGAARWDDGHTHQHQGNDVAAAFGAPVVAPFDGVAAASRSDLGGLTVRVTGARGYVANAHLSRYGTLGSVRAGTVVGYVGTTGNAQGPHVHFEWHPGGGGAIDPHDALTQVCPG
ncbi:MAG: M23 family metallopeptidase [Actinomycetota bacterium]